MGRYRIIVAPFVLLVLGACTPYYADYPGYYDSGYYDSRYYDSGPSTVVAPALPPQVVLETRPYYTYRGYYYWWDADRDYWLYSRYRRGPWFRLPHSHYPDRFQYRGRWYEGRRYR